MDWGIWWEAVLEPISYRLEGQWYLPHSVAVKVKWGTMCEGLRTVPGG